MDIRRGCGTILGRWTWIVGYSATELLFWLAHSLYYTYTRMYIVDVLGEDYSFAALLAGAEEAPLLLAILFGGLADAYGRRRLILFGFGEAVAVALMGFTDIRLLPVLAAIAAGFYTIAYTAVMGVILAGSGGSGRRYSLVTLWGSVGWALGGPLAAILYPYGPPVEFTVSALGVAVAYLVAYVSTPHGLGGGEVRFRDAIRAVRHLIPLTTFIALSSAGLTAFYSAAALRLRTELADPLIYGLAYTTLPALTGAAARLWAGAVTDHSNPLLVLLASTLAYLPLNYGIAVAHGPVLVALWLIPLYPFREVPAYVAASRLLPQALQATAGSAISLAISVSGFIAAAVSPLLGYGDLLKAYMVTSLLILASTLALTPYVRRGVGT